MFRNRLRIVFFLSLVSAITVNAQVGLGKFASDKFIIRSSSAAYSKNGSPVKGSPYQDENFVDGSVVGQSKTYKGLPMRFNAYANNIEFLQDNRTYVLEPNNGIVRVEIGARTLVVGQYEFGKETQLGFLERLDSGRYSLLYRQTILFKESEEPTPMKYSGEPARFVKGTETFYYEVGGKYARIDKVKDFIESLPDHKNEVKAFAKENKTKREKEDLVKLFRYYNSL